MKILLRIAFPVLVCGIFTLSMSAGENEKSSAPYFQILGKQNDLSGEQLPLRSSDAKVFIDGTIARVHLTQRYANTGSMPLEAIYVFPASTSAAVHGMTMSTGGRVIAAKIRESLNAKAEYASAKSEKKTAALLEEHRPNVFQMSVANLMPGLDIDVEIEWTETIPAVDATYEFVFPTVVGPRYTGGSAAPGGNTWTANPHLQSGTPNPAKFTISADLTTTLPLAEVKCPSHAVTVDFKGKDRAAVKMDPKSPGDPANRDFILRWKLGNEQVDAGLLLHRGATENHFLLQVAPPPRVIPGQIPPRDYVMLLDVSGSMEGFPLTVAKSLLGNLVRGLKSEDTFNVVSFAAGSDTLSDVPLAANPANLELAYRFIDGRHSGGGTELEEALKIALKLPGGEGRSRSILLLTDGYVKADREATELIRKNIGEANVFTFGIGSSVNRDLLGSIARVGGGEPVIVTTGSEAGPAALKFQEMISSPVLAKVRISAEGVDLAGMDSENHGDVFLQRPLVLTGIWSGEPRGKIIVRGIGGNGSPFEKVVDLSEAAAATGLDHPALPVLWARERVRSLIDSGNRDEKTVNAITSLGLRYSLLTPYTSFLAVDETTHTSADVAKTVKQPVPLPRGVSGTAVSGQGRAIVENGSVPEPGSIGLIAFLVVLLGLQRQRDN